MRWNVAAAVLSASAGFIAVIVDGVDLSAEALLYEPAETPHLATAPPPIRE
jgi:hypothetical protein